MKSQNHSLVAFFLASVLCSPAGGAAPVKVETSSDPSFDPRLFPKLAVIVVEEGAERTSVAVKRSDTERSTAILFSDQTRLERAIEDEFITALMNKRYTLSTRSDLLSILKEQAVQDLALSEDNSAGIGKVLKVQAVMLVRLEAVRQAKAPKFREWADDTEKHKTKAKFVTLAMGIVTLELESGKTLSVPLERLSKADQDFIKLRSGRVLGTEDFDVAVGARLISVDGAKILWTGKCNQLVSATDTSPLVTAAKNIASAFPKREEDLLPPDNPETAKPAWVPGRIPANPPRIPTATRADAPATLTNSIGMKFVLIPAGEFLMGAADGDYNEQPHRVRITRPFYLGMYEVTQAEYVLVMGTNPSHFKGAGDRLPVESVSWEDAQEFCRKLSRLPDEQRVSAVYRLPTEAEWEYACRAGTTSRVGFDESRESSSDYAWSRANAGSRTHPVGQLKPNPWGLFDMHGNVREWCADWYDPKYYTSSPQDDPPGPARGSERVMRDVPWDANAGPAFRASYRNMGAPGLRNNCVGFRVARAGAF